MDGTDQLPFGIPAFAQLVKGENKKRLLCHELISVIDHGHKRHILVFDSLEHVPHNPNMVIEGLQRSQKFVEKQNEGNLPEELFLQFDNCLRENKNAYVCEFLSLLVERGVFKIIWIDFHPVGHTHNIVDQVASRLAIKCQKVDIPSREHLFDRLRKAYTPTPRVFRLDRVADFKGLVNPDGDAHYANSAIHEHCGILDQQYFRFERDSSGRVGFRCKASFDDEAWSTFFYSFREKEHGIKVENITACDVAEVESQRLDDIEKYLDDVKWRTVMNKPGVQASKRALLDLLRDPPRNFHWPDNGRFVKEDAIIQEEEETSEEEESEEEKKVVTVRRTAIFPNHRAKRTYEVQKLEVDVLVAADAQEHKDVQRFWVGQVKAVNTEARTCDVKWWAADREFGRYYSSWRGDTSIRRTPDVKFSDLLFVFPKLNSTKQLPKKVIDGIKAQLALEPSRRIAIVP